MNVIVNDSFSKKAKNLKLTILTAGYGEIEKNWGGEVINTPYSRFYFVIDGDFHIITDGGERIHFKKGNAYLIPAGSSYRFGCDKMMKHVYFHIQICAFDKIDLLGDISSPLSLPLDESYPFERLASLAVSESSFSDSNLTALFGECYTLKHCASIESGVLY